MRTRRISAPFRVRDPARQTLRHHREALKSRPPLFAALRRFFSKPQLDAALIAILAADLERY